MTDAEAHAVIQTYFKSNWTATDIFYDQVPGNPSGEFASLWVSFPGAVQTSVDGSNAAWRGVIIVQVDINTPSMTGTRRAVGLGDQVSGLFLGKDLSGIVLRDKTVYAKVVENFYRRCIMFNGYFPYTC